MHPARARSTEWSRINQATVEAAGGFPFVIATTGSYRLTSNLVYAAPNTVAIRIQDGGAGSTIDLNGFATIGPTSCAVSPQGPLGVGYTNNVFGFNAGTVAGTIDLGGNVCNDSATCP